MIFDKILLTIDSYSVKVRFKKVLQILQKCCEKGNTKGMKSIIKKTLLISIVSIYTIVMIYISLICISVFGIVLFVEMGDHLIYKHSIKNKEDMIQMLKDNQEEYNRIAQEAEAMFLQSDKNVLIWDSRKEYNEAGLYSEIFNDYPIRVLSVDDEENGLIVEFDFTFCPNPYTYWGIYRSPDGEPSTWGQGELEEENGIYTQIGSYFKYETEKIIDNWYYYQCMTS